MRKTIVFGINFLAILAVVIALMPRVEAYDYSDEYEVEVLVAYDEEWVNIARSWMYGYSPETLAKYMIWGVEFRFDSVFNIEFRIMSYHFWDSDDSETDVSKMLDEALAETGFTSGWQADILVAFTGQDTKWRGQDAHGISDKDVGAVLVEHTYPYGVGQATDNMLQHELSHLYNASDVRIKDLMCVMNIHPYWIDFPYYYNVLTACVTTNWCSDCEAVMMSNKEAWGSPKSHGGGGGGDNYLAPADPGE